MIQAYLGKRVHKVLWRYLKSHKSCFCISRIPCGLFSFRYASCLYLHSIPNKALCFIQKPYKSIYSAYMNQFQGQSSTNSSTEEPITGVSFSGPRFNRLLQDSQNKLFPTAKRHESITCRQGTIHRRQGTARVPLPVPYCTTYK